MTAGEPIACLGAGRMGRGIAVVFAYAGHNVTLVDCKERCAAELAVAREGALAEVRDTLRLLAELGLFDPGAVDAIASRIEVLPQARAADALASAAIIFEG